VCIVERMPKPVTERPDNGLDGGSNPLPATEGWLDGAWNQVTDWATTIPTWIGVTLAVVLALATLVAFPMLRIQAFKAGQRAGKKKTELSAEDLQDRKLLIAALVPAILFWVAVIVGSARGLTGFGRDDLKWIGGWELLVPFTLDDVAIAFALLAFRAVKKGLNPDRATRIAWAAMLASAGLNFFHEVGGSSLGAVYLAILSILGMLIFHEFLAQFEEGAAYVARENPKFGLRWFTWPTNTVCAWFAWRNYPVDLEAGTRVTVRMAVNHLEQVRADKAAKRAQQVDSLRWLRFAPWKHVTTLRTALDNERTVAAANADNARQEITELTARLNRQTAELTTLRTKVNTQAGSQPLRTAANAEPIRSEPTGSQQPSHTPIHDANQPENTGEFAAANPAENGARKVPANPSRLVQRPTHPLADDPNDSVRKLARAYSRKPSGTNSELAKLARVSDGTANRYLPKVRAAFVAAENPVASQLSTLPPLTGLPIAAPVEPVSAGTNGTHLTSEEN
jgi:hypothetical protein